MDVDQTPVVTPVPRSVRIATWLLWGVVALSGLTALLTVVLEDQLVRSWAEGQPADLAEPAFVPVALTMFVVLAALGWVLLVFFRNGYGWARWAIVALVVFAGFSSAIGLTRDLPPTFLALTAVTLVVNLALLGVLFHKDTTAFLRHD